MLLETICQQYQMQHFNNSLNVVKDSLMFELLSEGMKLLQYVGDIQVDDEHEDSVEMIRSDSLPRILLSNVLDLYSVTLF